MPRRRQVVVRFSDPEYVLVSDRAALAEMAVGAWIGEVVVAAATGETNRPPALPDLLRLHADVVMLGPSASPEDIDKLLVRLSIAIDALVVGQQRAVR